MASTLESYLCLMGRAGAEDLKMTNEIDEYYCDTPKPDSFTYHPYVTVCDACGLKFPYYDCYCELEHECIAGKYFNTYTPVDV